MLPWCQQHCWKFLTGENDNSKAVLHAWHCQWQNLSDTQPIRYGTCQILNLSDTKPQSIRCWTYQILNLNLSDTVPIRYRTYQISNLSDTEPIRYRTYQIPNLSETESIRYRTYQPTKIIRYWIYLKTNLSDNQCFGSASVLCGSGSSLKNKCGSGSHALTK